MSSRFGDFDHVVRLVAVFAVGVIAFLAWRAWMVPPDFGVYGHYRASALTDAQLPSPTYAGQAACLDCHDEPATARQAGAHAAVSCESCHGALGWHAEGRDARTPDRPDGRTACITCHAAGTGKPPAFPQVIIQDHAGTAVCVGCHQAHDPGLQ